MMTHKPSGRTALTPLQVVAQVRDDAFSRGIKLATEELTPKEANALRREIQEMYRAAAKIEGRYYAGLARDDSSRSTPTFTRELLPA